MQGAGVQGAGVQVRTTRLEGTGYRTIRLVERGGRCVEADDALQDDVVRDGGEEAASDHELSSGHRMPVALGEEFLVPLPACGDPHPSPHSHPHPRTIRASANRAYDTSVVHLTLSSPVRPPTPYTFDMARRK